MESFNEFQIPEPVLKGILAHGFTKPTPIQSLAVPKLLNSTGDKIGLAQTGTGKTAAFVIPLLSNLITSQKSKGQSPLRAIILTPTRELAYQIDREIALLDKFSQLKTVLVYGGVSYSQQIQQIKSKSAQILVGTPGRIIDLMDRKVLNLSQVEFCVLDEADEMLNMGFLEDVNLILKSFDNKPQQWMFSATMSTQIKRLVKSVFSEPEFLQVESNQQDKVDIEQEYYYISLPRRSQFEKNSMGPRANRGNTRGAVGHPKETVRKEVLYRLILAQAPVYGIIFCQTKSETLAVAQYLQSKKLKVDFLNGDLTQGARDIAMKKFRQKQTDILVCTDVAARGIDVDLLSHVFNYNLPNDVENYVHRIGRTGRQGRKGKAITLVSSADIPKLHRIQAFLHRKSKDIIDKSKIMTLTEKTVPTSKDVNKAIMKKSLETFFHDNQTQASIEHQGFLDEKALKQTFEKFKSHLSESLKSFQGKEQGLKQQGELNLDFLSEENYDVFAHWLFQKSFLASLNLCDDPQGIDDLSKVTLPKNDHSFSRSRRSGGTQSRGPNRRRSSGGRRQAYKKY